MGDENRVVVLGKSFHQRGIIKLAQDFHLQSLGVKPVEQLAAKH